MDEECLGGVGYRHAPPWKPAAPSPSLSLSIPRSLGLSPKPFIAEEDFTPWRLRCYSAASRTYGGGGGKKEPLDKALHKFRIDLEGETKTTVSKL